MRELIRVFAERGRLVYACSRCVCARIPVWEHMCVCAFPYGFEGKRISKTVWKLPCFPCLISKEHLLWFQAKTSPGTLLSCSEKRKKNALNTNIKCQIVGKWKMKTLWKVESKYLAPRNETTREGQGAFELRECKYALFPDPAHNSLMC